MKMRALWYLPLVLAAAPLPAQTPAPRRLTLAEAIASGRERGISAALARLEAKVSESRVAQRRADLLPSLTASGAATRQTLNLDEFGIPVATGVTDPFTVWRFQLNARQTVFDAGALTRLRAEQATALASGADAGAVGELAAAAAGLAYFRVLSAEETVRAREADSAVAASLLDQARRLVEAGTSPLIDATRSETQLAAVRTQLELARNQRDRTRLDLARALDLPPETILELTDSLPAVGDELVRDPAAAVRFALDHRAEVRAERNRTRALDLSRRAVGLEYVPSLSLGGAYNQSGRTLSSLEGTYAVQVLLSLPLLDGFRRPARQQEQSLRLEAQRIRQHDEEQAVATETRQALLDLTSAEQQVVLAEERLGLAELELSQARERFEAGVAGSVETTTAQGGLVAGRDGLIQARVNAAVARLSLRRALGVLDQTP